MRVSEPTIRKDSRLFEELCEALLRRGNAVQFRVSGASMQPNLLDGDDVLVAPTKPEDLRRGDVILARDEDGLRVHRVHSFNAPSGTPTLRSDTALDVDAATQRIFGRVVASRRGADVQQFTQTQTRFVHPLRVLLRRVQGSIKLRLRRLTLFSLAVILSFLAHAGFCAPAAQAQTADLQLTQTASVTAIAANTNYTYSEVVTNNSSSATITGNTIIVYMQTPAYTVYENNSAGNWNCSTHPGPGSIGPIICYYNPTLASGATASILTLTFKVGNWAANTAYTAGTQIIDTNGNFEQVVTAGTSNGAQPTWNTTVGGQTTDGSVVWKNVGSAAGTTIQSSATVTNNSFTDTNPSNNTSLSSIIVEPTTTSDFALSMSVSPTPVFVGSTFTYTLQVQNLGQATAAATSNDLTDTLPSGLTNVSTSTTLAPGWSCSGTTTVTCSSGSMAMGSTVTITITATAPNNASTLNNTATVSLPGDPNSANNTAAAYTVVQPIACATPGRDGVLTAPTTSTIVNTYFPPANPGTLASASTSVVLGMAAASPAAQTPIATGDLLLIIQMQDATINDSNNSYYGHGVPGDPAAGYTSEGSSGVFEFVTATSAVPITGGTLTFSGTGPTGGLLNSYYYNIATSTQGQQTFQVIRVPQYASATLSSDLMALAWNGSVGGVLALDVASQLTLGGIVALDALGFRGGGGITLRGAATTGDLDTDYVTSSPAALPVIGAQDAPAGSGANASKGEGTAGTPHWVAPPLSTITTSSTATSTGQSVVEGLPGGSFARGAPGNAGGGGTDGDPVGNPVDSGGGNDENSGGGAGGNGGTGGQGGYGWNSMAATNSTNGGFGGVAFPASTSAIVMGGGGGAGTTNNGSYYISNASNNYDCGATCTGIYSSGGYGGGIAIIHAGSVVGTGTITSNGQSTLSTDKDSTGGGGAGGSILVFANSGGLSGLTVSAVGGSAGNAWQIEAPGGFPGERHGPGGGGGGGVIFLSASPAASSVSGGANGYTDTVEDSYGATPGQPGTVSINNIITETPGTQSGAYCAGADLAVTNSASPVVVLPGGNITYTQTVVNNGPLDAVNVVFSEGIPANTTFQSINTVAGWTCTTPAVGGTGNITCTNPDFATSAGTVTFTVVVQVGNGTTSGTQIVDVDNVTSGTNDPNLANNTATAIATVGTGTQADLAVTNTASSPTVIAGSNFTLTAVVTNYGPATSTGVAFTEPTASNSGGTVNATFVSLTPPAGWSCTTPSAGQAGTITCTIASFAANATATFPIVMNAPVSAPAGTILSATANIAAATPDPNSGNNNATASVTVATAGQADLAVTATGSPNPVTPGNNITYTQSITNNGPTAITISGSTTVTFTDAIPANTTLASFTAPANWTCTNTAVGSTGTVTCTLNSGQTLAVGAIVQFPLAVKVNLGTASGTTITNSPNIASSVSDPNTANNTATVSTLVASPTQADVSITKIGSPNPVDQGTNLTYTLTITNAGPAVAQNVVVSDPLPAQVIYTSSSSTMGSCSYASATTTVTCNLGSLSVGSTAVVTINVNAAVFSSSTLATNTATVSSSTSDPNSSNNTSTFISTIQASTAVDISSLKAYSQPDGSVRLVWHTHEESHNLGFHVYREDGLGRHRVDSALIAGSAVLLRGCKPQHAAKTYAAVDSQPVPNASYWLEDLDINGTRSLHGPIYPEPAAAATEEASKNAANNFAAPQISPSLSQLYAHLHQQLVPNRTVPSQHPVPVSPPHAQLFNAADYNAVKISVNQEGWYHVPFSQLFAAGLSPGTDVRTLHLYAEGVEQPILLVGHTSGNASPADAMEFYGTGIDTPFSVNRVYWLVSEGFGGKRIPTASAESSESPAPASFPSTVIREDRTVYFAALLNGENNDNFFGAIITSDPTEQTLNVIHRDSSSTQPATLTLSLQGVTDQQQHSVSVEVNGASVGTLNFYGQVLASESFAVDPSQLLDGINIVTLTALDGDNDVSAVQSIQLEYLHTYTADSDWLQATAPAGTALRISGFTNSQVRLFDISDPTNIFEITGKVTLESGSYTIAAALPPAGREPRYILAFASDALSAPASIASHTPTLLDEQRAGADIVVISYPDFAAHLTPLVQLRESQGHKVAVTTTDQIFDDYNFGERSPFAMRNFLQDAVLHWQRKPQAVLLVGGASMDPRNYLGFGDLDFVPTRIIETAALKTASDDWFTDFQENGYATIPTGRLPARTTSDVDLLVSKIVGYEQGSDAGAWNGRALLIADQNIDSNFTSAVTSAAAALPSALQTSQILAQGADPSTIHSQIISALNNGALLVDYNGHGAEQQWSFVDLFDDNDAAALTNGGRLPIYLLMDCLNGLFQDVYAQTLAESLILAPNGGGVAVWASSGFTNQPPQASMNLALLNQLSTNPGDPLGLMILRAKQVTTDNDVRRTWVLFGDPSMKIHFASNSFSASASNSSSSSAARNSTAYRCVHQIPCAKENQ